MNKSSKYLLFISFMYGILINISNPAYPEYLRFLEIDDKFIGWFLASTSIGLLLMSPLWGALGDILDRNKVIAYSFIGFAIGQIIFGLVSNPVLMLVASMISGFSIAGFLVNLYSYINDSYKDEHFRNKMLSYAVSLYLVGGAIAYLGGGFLTDMVSNLRYIFVCQGLFVLLFSIYIIFEKTTLEDIDHHLSRSNFVSKLAKIRTLPWVPIYTITLTFFISFSHNNVRRFFEYYIIHEGYTSIDLGFNIFTVGIVSLLANLLIAPFFLKRMHNFRFLQLQFFFAVIFLYLTISSNNLMSGLYTYYLLYTVMLAVYEPTAISFMSENKTVPQGILVGVRQSSVGLGTTLGFIIGGYLYEYDRISVFHLSIFNFILVFIAFSVLVWIKRKDVKRYRKNYLEERK